MEKSAPRRRPASCHRSWPSSLAEATYEVIASVIGHDYLYRPVSNTRAELFRDGDVVGELEGAEPTGPPTTFLWFANATAVDAATGVILGVTLGVGAYGFFRNLLREIGASVTP